MQLGRYVSRDFVRGYYIDLSPKCDYGGPFDADGIPLLNYFGPTGMQYNPCAVAQYALGLHERWLEAGLADYQARFIQQADWLVRTLVTRPSGVAAWEYSFALGQNLYPVAVPWISALSQAQAISVLVRAYQMTLRPTYADTARRAFAALVTPVSQDGLLLQDDGETFLEECPSTPPSRILDGFMFSLFGVYDYALAFGDVSARTLFDQGVDSLERLLPRYELGFWSKGDLYRKWPPMIASTFYHNLHVQQLLALFALTHRPPFAQYSLRWNSYQLNPFYRMLAIVYKVLFKLVYY
jgi:hypothetical protein